MLSPTLCVYWTLEYVDISNLPEKIAFVKPAVLRQLEMVVHEDEADRGCLFCQVR